MALTQRRLTGSLPTGLRARRNTPFSPAGLEPGTNLMTKFLQQNTTSLSPEGPGPVTPGNLTEPPTPVGAGETTGAFPGDFRQRSEPSLRNARMPDALPADNLLSSEKVQEKTPNIITMPDGRIITMPNDFKPQLSNMIGLRGLLGI